MIILGKFLLWLSSQLYGLIVAVRNKLYDLGILKSCSFKMPVICVGNITVGGTGKTPHVIWLAGILSKMMSVAVLSRGYMRKSRGFRVVSPDDNTSAVGDEPLQMSRSLPGVKVFVDRDRVHGIREIMRREPDIRTVVLDDGFQHRAVKAGLNILLTDWHRLMTRDRLLPLGRLRESLKEIRRAEIIIVTKAPHDISAEEIARVSDELGSGPNCSVFFTTLAYDQPLSLMRSSETSVTASTSVLLVTGIADPSPLLQYLSGITAKITHLSFPDHHRFTEKDLAMLTRTYDQLEGEEKMIITTAKDAVRLKEITIIADHVREAIHYLPVRVQFIADEEKFLNKVYQYAGKDHKDR
jgi:tetraacyldisaccharide 4'-kinase